MNKVEDVVDFLKEKFPHIKFDIDNSFEQADIELDLEYGYISITPIEDGTFYVNCDTGDGAGDNAYPSNLKELVFSIKKLGNQYCNLDLL